MYSYDPLEGVPAASQHKVLGGEVHVWSEAIDGVNLDSVVWPRAAAAAEVLWSGPNNVPGKKRSESDLAMRLSDLRERLVANGVAAVPIQMPFCTMEKHQCDV
jgi:hexosaminidase